MNKLTMNPSNKKYYSSEYIKGWGDGVKAQYEARLKGEWAWDDKGYFYCNQCHKYPNDQTGTTDFCPHCGAEMKNEVI